jgi:hypothetical protein
VCSGHDGRLTVYGRGPNNTIEHIAQTAPNSGWTDWTRLPGEIRGRPTAILNTDLRLEVFYYTTFGRLGHTWQKSPNGPWESFGDLGGELHSHPVVGRNVDGRLEVFHIGEDDRLYTQWQKTVNGDWSGWQPGTLEDLDHRSICVAPNADGRLEVFAISLGNNALHHTWQVVPGHGPWKHDDRFHPKPTIPDSHLEELGTSPPPRI